MGTDRCKCVIGMVCEQDMDRMFMLLEIEFRHQIGANSVIDCMGYMLDHMRYMLDNGRCIKGMVKV